MSRRIVILSSTDEFVVSVRTERDSDCSFRQQSARNEEFCGTLSKSLVLSSFADAVKIPRTTTILQKLPPEIEFLPPPPRYVPKLCTDILYLYSGDMLPKDERQVIDQAIERNRGSEGQAARRKTVCEKLDWSCIEAFSPEEKAWVRVYGNEVLNTEPLRRLRFQRFYAVNSVKLAYFKTSGISLSELSEIFAHLSPELMQRMARILGEALSAKNEYEGRLWLDQQRLSEAEWIANWQVLQRRMPPDFKAEAMKTKSTTDVAAKVKESYPALNPTAIRLWLYFWQRQGKLLKAV